MTALKASSKIYIHIKRDIWWNYPNLRIKIYETILIHVLNYIKRID